MMVKTSIVPLRNKFFSKTEIHKELGSDMVRVIYV